MAASVVAPAWRILAEGVSRDVRIRWHWHKARRDLRDTEPLPPTVKTWYVCEVSALTGKAYRYWLGVDRDRWTTDLARAALFTTAHTANIYAVNSLLDVYRAGYEIRQIE